MIWECRSSKYSWAGCWSAWYPFTLHGKCTGSLSTTCTTGKALLARMEAPQRQQQISAAGRVLPGTAPNHDGSEELAVTRRACVTNQIVAPCISTSHIWRRVFRDMWPSPWLIDVALCILCAFFKKQNRFKLGHQRKQRIPSHPDLTNWIFIVCRLILWHSLIPLAASDFASPAMSASALHCNVWFLHLFLSLTDIRRNPLNTKWNALWRNPNTSLFK